MSASRSPRTWACPAWCKNAGEHSAEANNPRASWAFHEGVTLDDSEVGLVTVTRCEVWDEGVGADSGGVHVEVYSDDLSGEQAMVLAKAIQRAADLWAVGQTPQ